MNIWHDKYGTPNRSHATTARTSSSGGAMWVPKSWGWTLEDMDGRVFARIRTHSEGLRASVGDDDIGLFGKLPDARFAVDMHRRGVLYNEHVVAYKQHCIDASHIWAEEHGEDINEPFAELTEMIDD